VRAMPSDVYEADPRWSIAGEIPAPAEEGCCASLKAPIRRVTAPHAPVPFSSVLEDAFTPDAGRAAAAMRKVAEQAAPVA
jgi:acetoin:2,6-dichlorophenolindophenol oxidoreductase subunit beta